MPMPCLPAGPAGTACRCRDCSTEGGVWAQGGVKRGCTSRSLEAPRVLFLFIIPLPTPSVRGGLRSCPFSPRLVVVAAAPLLLRGGGGGLKSGIDGFFIRCSLWASCATWCPPNPTPPVLPSAVGLGFSWCCSSAREIDRTISVGDPRALLACWYPIEVGDWRWRVRGAVSFQEKKRLDFIHFEFSILLPVFRNTSSQNQKKPIHVWNESSLPLPSPFAAFLLKKIIVGRKA